MSDTDMEAYIGRLMGERRYCLLRALGQGGMGAVFRARDEHAGTDVAVKVLLPELAREATHLARFRREAVVMGLLDHPHVVRALDTGVEDDGTPWIAMELATGETLASLMRREGTLAVGRSVGIARQIVAALIAAHEVGVIHRDLKPGNVMIDAEDGSERAKVLDFGLARFIDTTTYQTLTMTGLVLGTPTYMSPEQAFGDRADQGADIYAVGAILHALLTGQPPFGRGPTHEVLPRLMAYERERLTETRRDLGDIVEVVERCLDPEPDQRYASAAELDAALAPFDREESGVRRWVRPATIHTLVLAPDPVLDAQRTRKRPKTRVGAPQPVAVTPPASVDTPRRGRPGGWALATFGWGVVAAFVAAAVVYHMVPEPDARATGSDAAVVDPAPTTPVRIEVPTGDTHVEDAEEDAEKDAEATPPEPRRPARGRPVSVTTPRRQPAAVTTQDEDPRDAPSEDPSSVRAADPTAAAPQPGTAPHLRVTFIVETPIDVPRLSQLLRANNGRLEGCLEESGELPTPPPYTGRGDWALTNGYTARGLEMDGDTPRSVVNCIQMVMNWVDPPFGDLYEVRVRVRAVAASRTSIHVRAQ